MAPSEKSITDAIKLTVQRVWNGPGRDELTVNQIRAEVEAKLDLDANFLKDGPWKQKSKQIVLNEHERLLNESQKVPSGQPTPPKSNVSPPKKNIPELFKNATKESVKKSKTQPIKTGTKRSSEADKAQSRKKPKKKATPSSDEESELSSPEDTPNVSEDEWDTEVQKAKTASQTATRLAPTIQAKQKAGTKNERNEGEGSNAQDVETKATKKDNHEAESDSDMSIVLDEAPKPKSKSKPTSRGASKSATAKSSKPPKATTSSTSLSPDEELLKTLQSQLVKCGVRKIWGVVLKEYGSDIKAKIRHLKSMLKDVGMEGRFSEARAKEIREARELIADLEAVKEGDAKWGMGREGRSKKPKERKKVIESESDGEADTRSSSPSEKPPPRVARAKMDLAFLGDEESDSDD